MNTVLLWNTAQFYNNNNNNNKRFLFQNFAMFYNKVRKLQPTYKLNTFFIQESLHVGDCRLFESLRSGILHLIFFSFSMGVDWKH